MFSMRCEARKKICRNFLPSVENPFFVCYTIEKDSDVTHCRNGAEK